MQIARIDDELITAEDFVKFLKLENAFTALIENVMRNKLTAHAAKKMALSVEPEEVQTRVDQFRRLEGLHRAQDTHRYLESLGVTVDEFESHIIETLYCEKMQARIVTPEAVEDYFRLHAPEFEAVDVSHIVVESEAKAKELMSLLEDEPECFADYAREHSLDEDTRAQGGYIGKLLRGAMDPAIEAKLFNADLGEPIGPFTTQSELIYNIYQVNAKYPAALDDATRRKVAKRVYDEWLYSQAQEHILEVI